MAIVPIRGSGHRAESPPGEYLVSHRLPNAAGIELSAMPPGWPPRRRAQLPARRGMTLLELMLVLALMVVIGAMALPAMQRSFDNQRLRMAGQQVRVQWNKACIRAMKTGQILMFRYEPGGSSFQVEPYFTGQEWLEADAQHSAFAQTPAAGQMSAVGQPPAASQADVAAADATAAKPRQLPEKIVFASGGVEADSRSVQIQQETQGALTQETEGAAPILFYPDGTTSDAHICLANSRQMCVEVTLRSLTGTAKVGPLMSVEEYQQLEQLRQ